MSYSVKGECRNTGKKHFKKGFTPWNKGKIDIYSDEHKKKISDSVRQRLSINHPMKGKFHSEASRLKIKNARIGQINIKGPKGKPWSEERKKAQKVNLRTKPVIISGKEYHPLWHELRKIIYKRDGWICQECDKHCHKDIACHHIDYDTLNNDLSNLITLCSSCHGKTLYQRENWIIHYRKKLEGKN